MKSYSTYRTFLKTSALKFLFSFLLISQLVPASAQDTISFFRKADHYIPARGRAIGIGLGVTYVASMTGLYTLWYKDYPLGNFHGFDDNEEWLQVDKVGHFSSAYYLGKWGIDLMQWTGMERKQAIWKGGAIGWVFLTGIEVFDGFSDQWGFSTGDMIANTAGSALAIGQELAWDEQRIQMKWSFYRKHYKDASLNSRSAEIFGKSTSERLLKDYNGQTYWLSTSLRSFFPQSRIPKWLQISVGTGAEGLFGANRNLSTDKYGNVTFDRTDIKRYRQWYLAPDIDLTKIKTKKKGIKFALNLLNVIKFPAPSLEFSNGKFKWNWLHI